jgi:hypothetical protein
MSIIDFLGVPSLGVFVISIIALICAAIAHVVTGRHKKYKNAKTAYDDFTRNNSLGNYNDYMKRMAAYNGDAEPVPSKTIPSGFVAMPPDEPMLVFYSAIGAGIGAGVFILAAIASYMSDEKDTRTYEYARWILTKGQQSAIALARAKASTP